MCWSIEASAALVVLGGAATVVSARRGQPRAIWLTLGYFTAMEALQVAGYAVVDQCGTPANRAVTLLSYLHIVFQPLFINAFALELVPEAAKARAQRWVYGACLVSVAVMLAQLLPLASLGVCRAGAPLCAAELCTVTGSWHIAWNIPYNGLMVGFEHALGLQSGFPTYMATVFLLPLLYGAWRFVLLHALVGPALAWTLTDNPNEMPAVWCLFSVAILLISLSPAVRRVVATRDWPGVAA